VKPWHSRPAQLGNLSKLGAQSAEQAIDQLVGDQANLVLRNPRSDKEVEILLDFIGRR
jgi:hypothetical protein